MKGTLIIPAIVFAVFSTSAFQGFAQTKKQTPAAVKKAAPSAKVSAVLIDQGKALMAKSDCAACHKVDVKLVGPAFKDVAKKYPATDTSYNLLAKKVISGGTGVWGQIPMSPHPALSLADAKKIVTYILSIKS